MSLRCSFVVAGDPAQLTGGYIYDARIVAALRTRGWEVEVVGLAGRFPIPDPGARQSLQRALASLPDGSRVVIDGLVLGGLPDIVAAHVDRLAITALIHHPLADETGLGEADKAALFASERLALSALSSIITTSAFTARRLADYGVAAERITVVEPGAAPSPLAAADHEVPQLLCVATLTPRKGHLLLVEALARIEHLAWSCDCIGSLARDPVHADRVATAIAARGLAGRIRLCGEQAHDALGQAYAGADLFVLPSWFEGYGMVVTEALAFGLPVLTTRGGALAEILPPGAGLQVPPGDVDALAEALRSLLEGPALRHRLRDGARQARLGLRGWEPAGHAFAAALLADAA